MEVGNSEQLAIGLVRRGYSASGGAESYLLRLARGIAAAGHRAELFTASDWPPNEWLFGPMHSLRAKSARQFADEFEKIRATSGCDVTLSLERVWQCDVFRAGDGVHRAWLERRKKYSGALQNLLRVFNRKNRVALELEESLFAQRGARRVIANSEMVRREIMRIYNYPAEQIDVVPNGVPAKIFREARAQRAENRQRLGLAPDQVVALFVGSGWERKGLRFAIAAAQRAQPPMELLVAGRGDERSYRMRGARFLGVRADALALYGAADIFILPTIYDPFSNACLEALAAGLPVITTASNGFSEIMEDKVHGSVVADPANVAELSAALTFWSDEQRRAEVYARNLELAARFDISKNVERTLQILRQAAATAVATSGKIRKT